MVLMKRYQYKNRRRKGKKWVWVTVVVVVLLAAAGVLLWMNRDKIDFLGGGSKSSETDEKSADKEDDGAKLDKTDPKKPPIEQNWTSDDRPMTFDVWVTYQHADDQAFRVRVQTNKYLSGGTCTLKIGDYSETVNVVPSAQASTCEGFDVPTSNFSGKNFVITVVSGDDISAVKGEF